MGDCFSAKDNTIQGLTHQILINGFAISNKRDVFVVWATSAHTCTALHSVGATNPHTCLQNIQNKNSPQIPPFFPPSHVLSVTRDIVGSQRKIRWKIPACNLYQIKSLEASYLNPRKAQSEKQTHKKKVKRKTVLALSFFNSCIWF